MDERVEKLVEWATAVIENETHTTEGEYSPLAGPITDDKTELYISPEGLARQILSHPDLALRVKLKDYRGRTRYSSIPLAEALGKEEESGKS